MKQTAAKEGLTPRELADRNAKRFREMAGLLGLSNDDFIRTTEPRHYRASEEIWRRMEAAGDIFLKNYGGWYSVRDEAYYNESETVRRRGQGAPRPAGHAGRVDRGGDVLLPLSAYQDKLLAHYDANPDFILPPERRNEVVSFVKAGSRICRSRARRSTGAFRCRAQARGRQELAAHVMYVWVDALTNYITGVGFPDEQSAAVALLAGRRARHRQGHPALPRRLLAGVPDVGRAASCPSACSATASC